MKRSSTGHWSNRCLLEDVHRGGLPLNDATCRSFPFHNRWTRCRVQDYRPPHRRNCRLSEHSARHICRRSSVQASRTLVCSLNDAHKRITVCTVQYDAESVAMRPDAVIPLCGMSPGVHDARAPMMPRSGRILSRCRWCPEQPLCCRTKV